jgi:uncharacterized coiled-coil protein SlyX
MTKQYQEQGKTMAVIQPKPRADKDTKIANLQDQIQDLQKELAKNRSELARLKNRVSDLERQVAPRG